MKHLLLVAVLLVATMLPTTAQQNPAADEVVIYGGEDEKPAVREPIIGPVDVAVNGVVFFTIPGAAIGYSSVERREIVETRITEILSTCPLAPVTVRPVRGKPTVYVGNIRLITVYPADVRNTGADSAKELAAKWAEGTAAALQVVAPTAFRPAPRGRGVYVLGIPWFEVYDKDGFSSLPARVDEIQDRIAGIARNVPNASDAVNVRQLTGWAVFVSGSLLITATDEDAKGNGVSCPQRLMNMWADQARALFDELQSH